MNLYEKFVQTLKSAFGADPEKTLVTGANVSSALSAEIVLIASILIVAITIRVVSPALMIFTVIALILLYAYAGPIMPRLYKEHSDDLSNMMFYAVIALAIIAFVFYWGVI